MLTRRPILEYLYDALNSPIGIVIRSSDITHTRAKLYAARKDALDSNLDCLSLIPSPVARDQLWIVKARKPDAT